MGKISQPCSKPPIRMYKQMVQIRIPGFWNGSWHVPWKEGSQFEESNSINIIQVACHEGCLPWLSQDPQTVFDAKYFQTVGHEAKNGGKSFPLSCCFLILIHLPGGFEMSEATWNESPGIPYPCGPWSINPCAVPPVTRTMMTMPPPEISDGSSWHSEFKWTRIDISGYHWSQFRFMVALAGVKLCPNLVRYVPTKPIFSLHHLQAQLWPWITSCVQRVPRILQQLNTFKPHSCQLCSMFYHIFSIFHHLYCFPVNGRMLRGSSLQWLLPPRATRISRDEGRVQSILFFKTRAQVEEKPWDFQQPIPSKKDFHGFPWISSFVRWESMNASKLALVFISSPAHYAAAQIWPKARCISKRNHHWLNMIPPFIF